MQAYPSHSVLFWLKLVTVPETVLLLLAFALALRKDTRSYSAMRGYLLVNAIGSILACVLLAVPSMSHEPALYAGLFWITYAGAGVLTFLTAQQIFRDALAPVPGLRRLALVAYRWVAVVSVALTVVPAAIPLFLHAQSLHITLMQAMRCVSVLEFCLLAFILLSAQTLGISFRSRIVGITLGFGVLAAVDTVCFMVLVRSGQPSLPWILVREIGCVVATTLWLVYLIKPEPGRFIVQLPANSQLGKWNEIAVALGKPAPHVTLTPPQGAFFLQDVEQVVDRVLSRNATDPPR